MDYKLALKSALYDFTGARDFYREATVAAGIPMHKYLVTRYIELQALILNPITPHWSEHIWSTILHKPQSIHTQLYPTVPSQDPSLTAAREYVRSTTYSITSAEGHQKSKLAKGKNISFDPKKPKRITIFAAASFPAWQDPLVELVRTEFAASKLGDDKEFNTKVMKTAGKEKKAMPFAQGMRKRLVAGESPGSVLDRKMAYDEVAVLKEMIKGLGRTLGCKEIDVILVEEGGKEGKVVASSGNLAEGEMREELPQQAENAVPGAPTFVFENITE